MSNRVFVIGGGPSLRKFDWRRLEEEHCVVSNVALFNVPKAEYFVTMDHSFMNKVKVRGVEFRRHPACKVFVCGLHHPYLKEMNGRVVDTRWNRTYDLRDFDLIVKSRVPHGCGTNFKDFRSGENSGYSAFQLAVLLGYDELYLLGMDMTVDRGTTHFHGYYPNQHAFPAKLKLYAKNFRVGLREIANRGHPKVYSCSPVSELNDTAEYAPWEEVLCKVPT